MSISGLPKELRLQIWAIAYFSQTSRLVTITTSPHDENHAFNTFCPRYSPSPAPTVVNICQESRAEARYQATKAGHIVALPYEYESICSREFYFRFDKDILYLQLVGTRVKHYDNSPEVGFLAHFQAAVGCAPSLLQNIALTDILLYGRIDGTVSNILRYFPNISHIIMMVPEDIQDDTVRKAAFLHAARRMVTMYRFDREDTTHNTGENFKPYPFLVDFATLGPENDLRIVPKEIWRDWDKDGDGWATMDGPIDLANVWA